MQMLGRHEESMIQAGFAIENPLMGLRLVVIEGNAETGGMGWMMEVHHVPHAGPDLPEHVHPSWTERFEILAGDAKYNLDGGAVVATYFDEEIVPELGHEDAVHSFFASFRQVIETVHALLMGVFGLNFPRARSYWGLPTRIASRVAALNLAILINYQYERAPFSIFNMVPWETLHQRCGSMLTLVRTPLRWGAPIGSFRALCVRVRECT